MAYHPEIDEQTERTIRTLEDMLRATIMDFGPTWHDHLALVEFAYNKSYHRSIGMAPFEAYIDAVVVGEHVFLRVSSLRKVMRFELKGKLSPRFINMFEILEKVGDVAYSLAFPPYLSDIHDLFHVSLLRQYVENESHILHPTEVKLDQDLSYVERPLRILHRKDKVLCNKRIPLVMVQLQRRRNEEAT
ncbi:uncharacterized protein [Henckelia pumila]|uniref:uncharacterized protein n=1 Tax=Henckelia pumila TaxID=405737 RepID=UPI003C6E0BC8